MSDLADTVYIVDDDPNLREGIKELLDAYRIRSVSFASAGEYLIFERTDAASCLILDIELPDINGLDFQRRLAGHTHPPIIFLTGHGDIPSSVRAIKNGADDFLIKPVNGERLIAAVRSAIERDRTTRAERSELFELKLRLHSLSSRERDVLPLVVSGLLNKQAAAELAISEITLEIHRRRIMQKMKAASLPDLVRIAEKLQIPITHSRRPGSE
jgi:FixJ family two-component response regulator